MNSLSLSELTALSPVDGRYRSKTQVLSGYFSEYALMRYRVRIEVEYFIALCQWPLPQLVGVSSESFAALRKAWQDFSAADAQQVKAIERRTNHDVKAIEYFVKSQLEALGLSDHAEFVHFGLTSQDVNNTAIPLALREAHETVLMPALLAVTQDIEGMAERWADVPMLAFTHGQPASPTRLGKEMAVFAYRLRQQIALLAQVPFAAKFGGATGNFNAHHAAYPDIPWQTFARQFVEDTLGLSRSSITTQIENYDHLAAYLDGWKRIHTILTDFSRDIWQYISMGYFGQKINAGEVGSSAMPHKVNPIDFENAEGNLGVANALFEHLSAKLPVSRLQRDLTDSTVLRNLGVPFGHSLIALASLQKGISKLLLHPTRLHEDLEANWAVVAEGIQTILRREGYPQPYEALKALTRTHERISAETIRQFAEQIDVSPAVRAELLRLSPHNYLGLPPIS